MCKRIGKNKREGKTEDRKRKKKKRKKKKRRKRGGKEGYEERTAAKQVRKSPKALYPTVAPDTVVLEIRSPKRIYTEQEQ